MYQFLGVGWIAGVATMGRMQAIGLNSILLLGGCGLMLLIWRHFKGQPRHDSWILNTITGLSLSLMAFFSGSFYANHALDNRLSYKVYQPEQISQIVYIRQLAEPTPNGFKQVAQIVDHDRVTRQWILYFDQQATQEINTMQGLGLGQYYKIHGMLRPVHGYANAGGFDQEKWFIQQNWLATLNVHHFQSLRPIDLALDDLGWHLKQQGRVFERLRLQAEHLRLSYRIRLTDIQKEHSGLLLALLSGDRSYITPDTQALFQRFGISHLLAISGPHVLVLASLVTLILTQGIALFCPRLYLIYARPKLLMLPFLLFVLLYTAFVGFEIPAIRTLLLVSLTTLLIAWNGRFQAFKLLLLSACLCLLIDPFSVLSAAFWLSYGACFILMRIYQSIQQQAEPPELNWTARLKSWFRVLFESQWKIFIALLPLIILFFKEWSWIAPVANLIAIPILGAIVVPLNIVAACIDLFSPALGSVLFTLAHGIVAVLLICLNWVDQSFNVQPLSLSLNLMGLISLFLAVFIVFLPRGILPKPWALLCILPILTGFGGQVAPQITVLDVGQGQAVFLQDHTQNILLDTGGYFNETQFSIGQHVVVPFLRQQGVKTLDLVLLSHLDQDHSGALPAIADRMPIKEIVANEPIQLTHLNQVVLDRAHSQCSQGQIIQSHAFKITVLSPATTLGPLPESARNEASCVLHIEFKQAKELRYFLVMGDAGWETEYKLLQQYPYLKVDVIVLGHHGSKHSSAYDFLAYYRPKLALVSAGYLNRYGHPSLETQARLQDLGIQLYRTDQAGSIQIFPEAKPAAQLKTFRASLAWLNFPNRP